MPTVITANYVLLRDLLMSKGTAFSDAEPRELGLKRPCQPLLQDDQRIDWGSILH